MFVSLILLSVGGMLLALALCPITKIAWQFVRLIGIIALAATVMIVIWSVAHLGDQDNGPSILAITVTGLTATFALASISLAPLLHVRRYNAGTLVRAILALGGIAGLIAGSLWPASANPAAAGGGYAALVSHILGGWLLGSVTVTWLLGHRYLTASEMTIDPLKRATQLMITAFGARWAFLAGMLVGAAFASADDQAGSGMLARLAADWLIASVRIGVGLVLPTVFTYMTWQCVKLRSTQSATGILFFMSVLVVVGELASRYLADTAGCVL